MRFIIVRKFEKYVFGKLTEYLQAVSKPNTHVVHGHCIKTETNSPLPSFTGREKLVDYGIIEVSGLKGASNVRNVTTTDKARILKPLTMAMLALVIAMATFLFSPSSHAADAANDSAGPTDPGFAPWVTAQYGIIVGWTGFF